MRSLRSLSQPLKVLLIVGLLLLPFTAVNLPARASSQQDNEKPEADPGVVVLDRRVEGNRVTTVVEIPATKATFISSGLPNNNFGYSTQLGIGYNSPTYQAMRILAKYNLDAIPANATINSASFQIYQYQSIPSNDGLMGIQVQYAKQSWDQASATWNNANFIGENPPLGVGNFDNTPGWKYGTATNVVRQWYSGAKPNYGVLLIADESPSPNRSRWFYSNYQGTYYPRLTVDYTTQCDNVPPTAYITSITPQTWFNSNPYSPASFNVAWTGYDSAPAGCPASGMASYKIWYSTDNVNWAEWKAWSSAVSGSFNLQVSSGTRVYFYAQGQDKAGNKQAVPSSGSGQMNTIVDTAGPNASIDPLPDYTTNTAFVVSWSGWDDASGVATYSVQQSIDGGAWQALISNTPQTSYQVYGASTGQTYAFRVQATDRMGNIGNWSQPVDTIIFANPFAFLQPINPSLIQSTTPNSNTINLYWTGVTPPGTSITQYVVWKKIDGGSWVALTPVQAGGPTGSYAFNIAQQGSGDGVYSFKVTATNNAGQSTPPDMDFGQASAYVDHADKMKVSAYLPIVTNNAHP